MDTREILSGLQHIACTASKRKNYGVFPSDHLPQNIKKPAFIVANTDKSNEPGTHWVAFYVPVRGPIEYFDSFGMAPRNKYFKKFLKEQSQKKKQAIWNRKRLQSDFTSVCGHYCCVYLHHRCMGRSMASFVGKFNSKNYKENDLKILNMYSKITTDLKKSDYGKYLQIGGFNLCMQTCKPRKTKK